LTSKIFNKFKKEKGIYVKSSIVESFDVESFDDGSGVAVRSGVRSDVGSDVESFDVESFDDGSDVGTSHSDFQRLRSNRLRQTLRASVEGASVEGKLWEWC